MTENYLLDTDIIIYWLKNKYPKINNKIKQISENCIYISSITVAELYFGAFNSKQKDKNIFLIDKLLKTINVINFDENIGKIFGNIKADLKNKGQLINDSDLFIAATAISNNMILVTNNERHFKRIITLKVENWSK